MKRFHLTFITMFSLLLIAGCSKHEALPKPSFDIVGHWQVSKVTIEGTAPEDDSIAKARESRLEVIFRANESCKITIWDKSGEVTDDIEGRYLLEDDALTISGPTIANYTFHLSTSSGSLMLNMPVGDEKVNLTLTKRSESSNKQ